MFLTWRLQGSLPQGRVFPPANTHGQAFVVLDRLLDTMTAGPVHLRRPEFAGMVVEALRYHDRNLHQYHLHSYVVMPNRVHLLITPEVSVSKLMHSLKRFTGREGNRMLGVTGQPFWQDESFDRLVRDDTELARIARYIEMNPVRAGLAAAPDEFPWSSARPIDNRPQVDNLPHSASQVQKLQGQVPDLPGRQIAAGVTVPGGAAFELDSYPPVRHNMTQVGARSIGFRSDL